MTIENSVHNVRKENWLTAWPEAHFDQRIKSNSMRIGK